MGQQGEMGELRSMASVSTYAYSKHFQGTDGVRGIATAAAESDSPATNADSDEVGGLERFAGLSKGARVMISRNLWLQNGSIAQLSSTMA